MELEIDPVLSRAETPPGRFFVDPAVFEKVRDRVFARSWHLVGDVANLKTPGQCVPTTLLEGFLDEPLLLTRDGADRLHCLSNVCTHRGTLVCEGAQVLNALRCRYHGRRFDLSGKFASMPEFDGVENFPRPSDDLPAVPLKQWKRFLFTALDAAFPFEELIAEMDARVGHIRFEDAVFDAAGVREYNVRANWALYLDNYLEGFHIPYVHPSLAKGLDYGSYTVETFRRSSLQVGIANSSGEEVFELPPGHPDAGKRVAAWYFWLFPNTMWNFYPWGLSINVVRPLAPDRVRVSFLPYVLDESKRSAGAGGDLDRVEREDESVVEAVMKGVKARLYTRGRYSVARENGTHHFHRLLAEMLG